jgi:hypothetical protein
MTTADSTGNQRRCMGQPVLRQGLLRVIGAGGQEPTARPDKRADRKPVQCDHTDQDCSHQVRRNAWANSRSRSALQARFLAPWGCESIDSGRRFRRNITAKPLDGPCAARHDSLATLRTVLRSTARAKTRFGTDIRSRADANGTCPLVDKPEIRPAPGPFPTKADSQPGRLWR